MNDTTNVHMNARMSAWVLGEQGPELATVPRPVPRANEVLVRVRACALNRADLGMLTGRPHGGAGGRGNVLGLEWAGEVAAVGAGVAEFRPGDRVMCSGAGGFAEYARCDAGRVFPLPDAAMSFADGATLPVALQTMHDAVVTHGGLRAGQRVLIQGASSGVGLMGMLIARELGASLVVGTSTDAARRAQLPNHGAHLALDSSDPGWVQAVLDATNGEGVDVLVDQVSGALVNQGMRATRITGRMVNVGRLGGMRDTFDFDLHALRRISYIGVTFRTRSPEEVRTITDAVRRDLWPALTAGRLRLPIAERFAFGRVPDALACMKANRHFGKIVVDLA